MSSLVAVLLLTVSITRTDASNRSELDSVLLTKNIRGLDAFEDASDLYYWPTHYLDEYDDISFKTIVQENSIDRRLSNMIFTQELYVFTSTNANGLKNGTADTLEEYNRYINRPEVNQELCTSHLRLMIKYLDELAHINDNYRKKQDSKIKIDERHIHLARVMDSYGRYMSGSLVGRSRMLGSSNECLETKLLLGVADNQQVVGTRFCGAQLDIKAYLEPKLQQFANQTDAYIEIGICLPNTCHSNSLADNKRLIQRLIDSQFQLPEAIYADRHREVVNLFCLNDGNSSVELPISGKILIILMCAWVVAMLIVTNYSSRMSSSDNHLAILASRCMDLKIILSKLVGLGTKVRGDISAQSRIDLNPLDFVKFVSLYMVVLGHALLLYINYGPDLHRSYAGLQREAFVAWVAGRQFYTDTFFVISGLLLVFGTLQRLNKSASPLSFFKNWYSITISRYLRLVPIYFLVFWFKKSIWLHAGTGLMWPKTFNKDTLYGACRHETWLTPFLPIAAYLPLGKQCLPQGWTISCEIVFAIISPPLILGLIKRPRVALASLALIGTTNVIWMYYASMTLEPHEMKISSRAKGDMTFILSGLKSIVYTATHLRLAPLTFGAITGYFLHLYNERKINDWPYWLKTTATSMSFATLAAIELLFVSLPNLHKYVMPYIALQDKLVPHVLVLGRAFWTIANGVIFLRMVTDWKDIFFFKLVKGNLLRCISRICFAVMLIHFDVILFEVYTLGNSLGLSTISVISLCSSAFLHSIVLSAIVHAIFESPINNFVTNILQGSKRCTIHRKKQ